MSPTVPDCPAPAAQTATIRPRLRGWRGFFVILTGVLGLNLVSVLLPAPSETSSPIVADASEQFGAESAEAAPPKKKVTPPQIGHTASVGKVRRYKNNVLRVSATVRCGPDALVGAVRAQLQIWAVVERPRKGRPALIMAVSPVMVDDDKDGETPVRLEVTGKVNKEDYLYYGVLIYDCIPAKGQGTKGVKPVRETISGPSRLLF